MAQSVLTNVFFIFIKKMPQEAVAPLKKEKAYVAMLVPYI